MTCIFSEHNQRDSDFTIEKIAEVKKELEI
jgi:hypothetical protein